MHCDCIGTTRSSWGDGRSIKIKAEVSRNSSSSRCSKSQRLNCDFCLLASNFYFIWCLDFKLQHSGERSVVKLDGVSTGFRLCIHYNIAHLGRLSVVWSAFVFGACKLCCIHVQGCGNALAVDFKFGAGRRRVNRVEVCSLSITPLNAGITGLCHRGREILSSTCYSNLIFSKIPSAQALRGSNPDLITVYPIDRETGWSLITIYSLGISRKSGSEYNLISRIGLFDLLRIQHILARGCENSKHSSCHKISSNWFHLIH